MSQRSYAIFDTEVGRCALLWRGEMLTGVLLPAENDDAMRAAIRRRDPEAIEENSLNQAATVAIDRIRWHCSGETVDYSDILLDRSTIEPLANRIYDILLRTPFGATTTYGAIAEELGDKNLSRAVGAAMGANPFPIIIPCHRVTGAGGKMGGFTAPGGTGTKKKLLDIEGAFAAEKLPLFGG
ncbi:MAG TPA: MGMT family protein [Parvularculaceae bacterium]|nr:MGMT family protein [Parvularculaceae bacterium]